MGGGSISISSKNTSFIISKDRTLLNANNRIKKTQSNNENKKEGRVRRSRRRMLESPIVSLLGETLHNFSDKRMALERTRSLAESAWERAVQLPRREAGEVLKSIEQSNGNIAEARSRPRRFHFMLHLWRQNLARTCAEHILAKRPCIK